jgi:hypothetical protein
MPHRYPKVHLHKSSFGWRSFRPPAQQKSTHSTLLDWQFIPARFYIRKAESILVYTYKSSRLDKKSHHHTVKSHVVQWSYVGDLEYQVHHGWSSVHHNIRKEITDHLLSQGVRYSTTACFTDWGSVQNQFIGHMDNSWHLLNGQQERVCAAG